MKGNSAIIGASIIIGCAILGFFIQLTFSNNKNEPSKISKEYKFEMIPVNDNNVIIFNKETGEYWRKFLPNNEGPTNWEKEKSPITK
ncbi:hypothetical protein CN692_11875 [Bacillus sp. AFS002410]|uniref:hypothetical protein n=1 Tax=Bacillus sp. AFS002410 TaxID=2033481 RepID=UPI000BF0B3CF|nr:hypothetical protein [Bacillus sp. AFS002410]PEJ57780.1 hypothetical protein CN692_11875 [Bacillus sp. AFS002410]